MCRKTSGFCFGDLDAIIYEILPIEIVDVRCRGNRRRVLELETFSFVEWLVSKGKNGSDLICIKS
jgi:hypothetical protein